MKLQILMIKKFGKVDSDHICLAMISLNSALKKDEHYYQQVFLKKIVRNINDNLSDFSSSDDSDKK